MNGFGSHRIEGIGDKHVPWIHNVKNTDLVMAIDDNATMDLGRLFNEPAGRAYLAKQGVPEELIGKLDQLGFSGISNLLGAIKLARWYEMDERDVVMTVFTDGMELYGSRIDELREEHGEFTEADAAGAYHRWLLGQSTDHVVELSYPEKKRVHNLKYFTWVEQQGRTYEEIQRQWYDESYWNDIPAVAGQLDELIVAFNERTGLGK